MKNLRLFNLLMGIFHFIQSLAMVILTNDFKVPVNTNYLQFDKAVFKLVPVMEQLTEIKLGYLVASFLFLSAIAHFAISAPGIYEWYKKNLGKGINYARWIEYSFSSSVMIVVVALLVGVYDFSSLLLMFSLNATMIFFGWMMEVHNQTTQKTNWTAFIMGCFAGAIPWVVVALYLFGSGEGDAKAPDFVYYIFFSIFLFFNVFAVNMFLQYKKIGKWKDYLWGEKVYIVLSLVAKSLLAWQVFAGTLRPV